MKIYIFLRQGLIHRKHLIIVITTTMENVRQVNIYIHMYNKSNSPNIVGPIVVGIIFLIFQVRK